MDLNDCQAMWCCFQEGLFTISLEVSISIDCQSFQIVLSLCVAPGMDKTGKSERDLERKSTVIGDLLG